MSDEFPLAGLKIVITRPRDQAENLVRAVDRSGGIPVLFPLLEITAVSDTQALNEQVSRLTQFELAIFISPNAVKYGIASILTSGPIPDTLRIATVGQGSARALRELGIENVIAPTERFDSEGLLAMPELQNVKGWNVMIFRGDGGRELLGDTLKSRGARVEYATCYIRSKPQQGIDVLLGSKPDAITVTSSEALGYLWQMLDVQAKIGLSGTALFVPHPRIAELAKQQGWQNIRLAGSGDDGMLAALKDWAAVKGRT